MKDYNSINLTKIFPTIPTYYDTDSCKQVIYQEAKLKLNSLYGKLAMSDKENNMRDNEFQKRLKS